MVSPAIERFMRLEKVVNCEDWLCRTTGYAIVRSFKELVEKRLSNKFLLCVPYNLCSFYQIYDWFEERGFDNYKIYPIMDKAYWIVEVKSDGNSRVRYDNKGQSGQNHNNKFLCDEVPTQSV